MKVIHKYTSNSKGFLEKTRRIESDRCRILIVPFLNPCKHPKTNSKYETNI